MKKETKIEKLDSLILKWWFVFTFTILLIMVSSHALNNYWQPAFVYEAIKAPEPVQETCKHDINVVVEMKPPSLTKLLASKPHAMVWSEK